MPNTLSRALRLTVAVVAVFAGFGVIGSGAVASAAAPTSGPAGYLALGDSVAFGYVPPNAVPPPNYQHPNSLVGYPEDLARALNIPVANASCPGETTMSFLAVGAQSNGCENSLGSAVGYRTVFPLHVSYAGTQMAYAIRYLQRHPATRLVTIDIGANDAFLCQATTPQHCLSGSEISALLTQIKDNLSSIYSQIRVIGHYSGPLVALSYYSTNYASPLFTAEVQVLNRAIASVTSRYNGVMANGFQAFKKASARFGGNPCAAGLLIKLPNGTCNIHPSPAGHLLLAAAIARAIGA
jgi:lysophospholipase L1-like esterase